MTQHNNYISREKVCGNCNNKGFDCGKEKCPVYKTPTSDVKPGSEVRRLSEELGVAIKCIFTIEDALNRGIDIIGAREAIETWEKDKAELKKKYKIN